DTPRDLDDDRDSRTARDRDLLLAVRVGDAQRFRRAPRRNSVEYDAYNARRLRGELNDAHASRRSEREAGADVRGRFWFCEAAWQRDERRGRLSDDLPNGRVARVPDRATVGEASDELVAGIVSGGARGNLGVNMRKRMDGDGGHAE